MGTEITFSSKTTVSEIVEKDLFLSYALDHMGIDAVKDNHLTVEELCKRCNLPEYQLRDQFALIKNRRVLSADKLENLDVRVVVAYLIKVHREFVKGRLSYLNKLIFSSYSDHMISKGLLNDLRIIYPIFTDDFIHHIHEEEDVTFTYILDLDRVLNGDKSYVSIVPSLEKYSVSEFLVDHMMEDEMEGIRQITKNFKPTDDSTQFERILLHNLNILDQDLTMHADIENHILFRKAYQLENQVKNLHRKIFGSN